MKKADTIKILLMNSYSFSSIWENWKKGTNPSHFLMGKVELDKIAGFDVTILEHEKYPWLDKVGNILKIPHLDQQIRALLILRKFDALYLPYPFSNSKLITILKALRLISTPIVVLVHQNVPSSSNKFLRRVARRLFFQYDAYAFFSNKLKSRIEDELKTPNYVSRKFTAVKWGPDSHFYAKFKPTEPLNTRRFAVCAGTMDRDFDLIIESFREIDFDLKIFCTPGTIPKTQNIPGNVVINTSWIPYNQLLEEYKNASFVIIPIKSEVKDKGNTYGLTVLLDALALGKPVIMTHHEYIDIDLEKEKIGMWVKTNDESHWKNRLKSLVDKEEELKAMGQNAYRLYQERYNSNSFASEMATIFKRVVEKS